MDSSQAGHLTGKYLQAWCTIEKSWLNMDLGSSFYNAMHLGIKLGYVDEFNQVMDVVLNAKVTLF